MPQEQQTKELQKSHLKQPSEHKRYTAKTQQQLPSNKTSREPAHSKAIKLKTHLLKCPKSWPIFC
jgi:hypothetical protein